MIYHIKKDISNCFKYVDGGRGWVPILVLVFYGYFHSEKKVSNELLAKNSIVNKKATNRVPFTDNCTELKSSLWCGLS